MSDFRGDLLHQISLLTASVQRLTLAVANKPLLTDREAAARIGLHVQNPKQALDKIIKDLPGGGDIKRVYVGRGRRWPTDEIDKIAVIVKQQPLPEFAKYGRPSRKPRRKPESPSAVN